MVAASFFPPSRQATMGPAFPLTGLFFRSGFRLVYFYSLNRLNWPAGQAVVDLTLRLPSIFRELAVSPNLFVIS